MKFAQILDSYTSNDHTLHVQLLCKQSGIIRSFNVRRNKESVGERYIFCPCNTRTSRYFREDAS